MQDMQTNYRGDPYYIHQTTNASACTAGRFSAGCCFLALPVDGFEDDEILPGHRV